MEYLISPITLKGIYRPRPEYMDMETVGIYQNLSPFPFTISTLLALPPHPIVFISEVKKAGLLFAV